MPPLIALGAALAPEVIRFLAGERAGDVAQAVGRAVEVATGTRDPDQAGAVLAADPAKALDLKVALARIAADEAAAERQAELEALRAGLADVADARRHGAALAASGTRIAWVPAALTGALVAGFFFTLWALLTQGGVVTGELRETMLVLIGAQAAAFQSAIQYWLGTSRGAVEMRQGIQHQATGR